MTVTGTSQSRSRLPDSAGGRIDSPSIQQNCPAQINRQRHRCKGGKKKTLLHSIQFRLFSYVAKRAAVVMMWSWSRLSLLPFSKVELYQYDFWIHRNSKRKRSLPPGDGIAICYAECTRHSAYIPTNTDVIRISTPYKNSALPRHTKEFSECNFGMSVL